jgi:hypothetical protein
LKKRNVRVSSKVYPRLQGSKNRRERRQDKAGKDEAAEFKKPFITCCSRILSS